MDFKYALNPMWARRKKTDIMGLQPFYVHKHPVLLSVDSAIESELWPNGWIMKCKEQIFGHKECVEYMNGQFDRSDI